MRTVTKGFGAGLANQPFYFFLTFGNTGARPLAPQYSEVNKKLSYSRGTARRAVSKFVLCFTSYESWKCFKQRKWPSRSFKGIGRRTWRT